ncbi:MAG: polysaccharide biosynthesis tyrosine autokinase [Leptolyngbyaceae cyanobacterium RU_5_1]|nr:polysaccharide biosynthesis tyrosine autokinase [Leptolyngbyaceae cyanobacterium RU_5_1]
MQPSNSRSLLSEQAGKLPVTPVTPIQFSPNQPSEPDLRHWFVVFRRQFWLGAGVAIATATSVWLWTTTRPPVYEGRFQLLVEPVTADNRLDKLAQLAQDSPPAETGLDYSTQIQVLRSPQLMTPILEILQASYPSLNYDSLLSQMMVTRLQETKILEVRYQSSDPDQVQFVLDQLSQGYLRYSLQERQTSLRQGVHFVDDQLNTLQQRVDKLQQQLQNFRQYYKFIDPELQAQKLAEQTKAIADQKLETQKQLAETETVYNNLLGNGAAPALRDSTLYQRLLGQLRDVETKIATESARFSGQNPTIAALQDQQQNLIPLLQQEARRVLGTKLSEVANQIEVLQVRSTAIANTERRLNQQLNQLPAISRQYTDLQRELKVASESLNRFLATRETLQVEAAQKDVPWQLISAPQKPTVPTSPNVQRNLILAAIAGLLLGVAAALMAERLDNTFHSTEELKEQLKLPLLGVIPFDPSLGVNQVVEPQKRLPAPSWLKGKKESQPYVKSAFSESFRSLYTNIRMLSSDKPIQSLVVSSALPGDGKSTVAVHLAIAAAVMGQRVLLVDADLRRPRVDSQLNLPNLRGLSNLLTTTADFNQIIQSAGGTQPDGSLLDNNLFVLTSGQSPPDSTKLLSSQKMRLWMEKFQANFDLVIYDSPPLVGLADSTLLAPHTDGVLLVVGMGRTERAAILQATESLRLAHNISTLGVVANGSKTRLTSSYHYYN